MVLRQQMIGQYRLFLPETAKKVRHRPFGIRRTRKKTNRRRPHGNGTTASGDGQSGQARCGTRKSTLRRVLEYLPQSTRMLSAKYCTASRTPVFRLTEKRDRPTGRPSARSRFLRRKETGQSPRRGRSGAKKAQEPASSHAMSSHMRPLPHGNAPEGSPPPSYRSMSTVA